MASMRETTKHEGSNSTKLILIVSLVIIALFASPLLSGSNHKCPVLREQDLQKGPSAQAVPAFARKYNVDCTYCHTAWPQLNRTGIIFRYLGYRMPYEVPVVSEAKKSSAAKAPALPPSVTSGLEQGIGGTNKQPPSPETIAEGKNAFNNMQCFTCHVNGGNIIDSSKPIKGIAFIKKYPDDSQIADVIRRGVSGTAMPGYANDRLSDEQLSVLIAYIRSLTPENP